MSVEYVNGIPLPDEENYRSSNVPSLNNPPEFLADDQWFDTTINDYEWLDFTEPYTKPNFLLSFRGRPFARVGDVQIISGQAGNGKSMLFSQIITAILHKEFGELRYELGDSIPEPKVLLIDTEQSKDDVIAGKNRIMELCGWGMQEIRNDFRIVMLRDTETAIQRWKKTLKAIYEVQPNVIVLDGLLDVVADFNNQTECAELIFKCLQVATYYKAAMMCVLHQNPLSSKLVGHLGSAAMRKVTDVLVVSKDKTKSDIIFNVSEIKARGHLDLEDWQFRVLPVSQWGRPEQINNVSSGYGEIDADDIKKWLDVGRSNVEWPAYESTIKEKIFMVNGIRGKDPLQLCIVKARNRTFLVPQPPEEYSKGQKHPKYYLNPELFDL